MKPFLLFIFLLYTLTVTGQTKRVSGDCITAVPIDVVQRVTYGTTRPPEDFGLIQEIKAGKSESKTEFEQEHFTAWYLLNIQLDGELVFEIVPVDSSDDYDFLLYPCTDTLSCVRILQKKVLPIRGNLSRNTLKNKGRTGLLDSKAEAFYGKGINPQFSRSLQVRKGEKYVLVLDNVYEHGKGHSLFFNYTKDALISGTVLNKQGLAVTADIELIDPKGNTVVHTVTDGSGYYQLRAPIKEGLNYSLIILNDSSFVDVRTVNTSLIKDSLAFRNITTVLHKLKGGARYQLGSINFYNLTAEFLPEAYPSLQALYQLMKRNPRMVIRLEGHITGAHDLQQISEQRSKSVYDYLVNKGIDKNRMSVIGFSNTKKIIQNARTEAEHKVNRRVEINVLSVDGR
jgi:outer membrane protein OmpA-like peptidoglycan-associated protein